MVFFFTFVVKIVTFVVTYFYICSWPFLHLSFTFTYVTKFRHICEGVLHL